MYFLNSNVCVSCGLNLLQIYIFILTLCVCYVCVSIQVCVWQQLQRVRTEISQFESQKRQISDTVKTLVVSKSFY